ncbi:hypothetical protein JTB14_022991 [Gonioctena quinquepunctata]|nr:hypothetical protein JTB14_022991 [Gonioctena quinquepunctata]
MPAQLFVFTVMCTSSFKTFQAVHETPYEFEAFHRIRNHVVDNLVPRNGSFYIVFGLAGCTCENDFKWIHMHTFGFLLGQCSFLDIRMWSTRSGIMAQDSVRGICNIASTVCNVEC